MLIRTILSTLLGCGLLAASMPAHDADRGPSTPEERKKALEYIHAWEADPLNPALVNEREWVLKWIIEIPDLHVTMCVFLDGLPKGNKKDSANIVVAQTFSQAAFLLENPDKHDDRLAEQQAGIEGALRVYEALLKANAKDRQPYLDDLIQRREAGTLAQFVHDRVAASCKK
jgi:hypothetical protein